MSERFNSFTDNIQNDYNATFDKKCNDTPNERTKISGICVETEIGDSDVENIKILNEKKLIDVKYDLTKKHNSLVFEITDIEVSEGSPCELCGCHPASVSTGYAYTYTETDDEKRYRLLKDINLRADLYEDMDITVDVNKEVFQISLSYLNKNEVFDFKVSDIYNFNDIKNMFESVKNSKNIKTQFTFLNDNYTKYFVV